MVDSVVVVVVEKKLAFVLVVASSSSLGTAIAFESLRWVAGTNHLNHLEESKLDCMGRSKRNIHLDLKEAFIEGYCLRQDHSKT